MQINNEDVYVDEKYWEVISSNEDRIIKEINAECDLHKDEIISLVKKIIRRYFGDGMPDHYEWRDDGCTYDISGYIVKTDKVNSNTTIKDFLENEYTGDREPTYESGMGFYHTRYCDGLDDNSEIRSFIYELAYNVLKRILLEEFPNDSISNDVINEILYGITEDDCNIYINSYIYDFEGYEFIIESS